MKNNILHDIPDYDGIGVYALIDNTGNMYIGSSKHINQRLRQHNQAIRSGTENKKILQAIEDGKTFHCSIIEKLDYGVCQYDIKKKETQYIRQLKPSYNISPGSYISPEFHLSGYNNAKNNGDLETAAYWLGMYQRLSAPIMPENVALKVRLPQQVLDALQKHLHTVHDEDLDAFIIRAINETMERDNHKSE